MNAYVLCAEIAGMLKHELSQCGCEWVDRISTDTVFEHFLYHDRQKSSMTVLIDHELGCAASLVRVTERATLVVKKRLRDGDEGDKGVSAIEAGRDGVEVSVNAEGLKHHMVASENLRQWVRLRLAAQRYE
jgi:hypothetical protein